MASPGGKSDGTASSMLTTPSRSEADLSQALGEVSTTATQKTGGDGCAVGRSLSSDSAGLRSVELITHNGERHLSRAHSCRCCNQKWPVPRTPIYSHQFDPQLSAINPATLQTLIVNQTFGKNGEPLLNPGLFEHVKFTHDDHVWGGGRGTLMHKLFEKRLLTEFDYHADDTGNTVQIFTGRQNLPLNCKHVRLITLNSWYMLLFNFLIHVVLTVVDMQSNLMLVFALFFDPTYNVIELWSRVGFTICWIASLVVTLHAAAKLAQWQYTVGTSPKVGDLITNCSMYDRAITFAAMVMFNFFDMEKQVRDIVILLHPYKAVQPYAAYKCEGHRAYLVGHKNAINFRISNGRNAHNQVMFTKTAAYAFKLYMLTVFLMKDNSASQFGTLTIAALSSVAYFVRETREQIRIRRDSARLKKDLLEVLKQHPDTVDPQKQREYDASAKLLALHFHQHVRHDKEQNGKCKTKALSVKNYHKKHGVGHGHCKTCGRGASFNKEDHHHAAASDSSGPEHHVHHEELAVVGTPIGSTLSMDMSRSMSLSPNGHLAQNMATSEATHESTLQRLPVEVSLPSPSLRQAGAESLTPAGPSDGPPPVRNISNEKYDPPDNDFCIQLTPREGDISGRSGISGAHASFQKPTIGLASTVKPYIQKPTIQKPTG